MNANRILLITKGKQKNLFPGRGLLIFQASILCRPNAHPVNIDLLVNNENAENFWFYIIPLTRFLS